MTSDYYETVAWDVAAWMDVIAIEYESLVANYGFDNDFRDLGGEIRLLDVGCGTGIFPTYLDPLLSPEIAVTADLLDMSGTSLAAAVATFDRLDHFTVGKRYLAQIEDIATLDAKTYEVVWAIHSLATVDLNRMPDVFERLITALVPGGCLYIYQLAAASAYQRIHAHYLGAHPGMRYMQFEDTARMLDEAGVRYETLELAFDHIVPNRQDALGRYLQKVVLDRGITVDFFEPLLNEFRGEDIFRFPQNVNLVTVRKEDAP